MKEVERAACKRGEEGRIYTEWKEREMKMWWRGWRGRNEGLEEGEKPCRISLDAEVTGFNITG